MNADSDNVRRSLDDQLSNLDDHLGGNSDDIDMLTTIQRGIGQLLADQGGSEAEIRRVLQERYESGALRKETYQLVKSMLDNYVTEDLATAPRTAYVDTVADASETVDLTTTVADATETTDFATTVGDVAADPPIGDVPLDTDIAIPDAMAISSEPLEKPAELGVIAEPEADEFSSTAVIQNDVFRPPTADESVQVGSVLRDRFMLQERVSGGSMGVVYRTMDRRLAEAGSDEPWVAVKVLSPQLSRSGPALRALQQEAAKGRCLAHPGIVRFIDLDRDDELYFIVMEWLEGRTLADILDSPDGKNISVEQAVDMVRQIGKALDYAHKCGIVHADVKPGNVMILPDGSTKLFDFGIARVYQSQSANASVEPDVLSAITPEYSSMQVLTGDEPVPADDVFSLACLLYRLVAGYRVFGPRNAAEAAEEGMKPQRLRELPNHQWAALRKALSFARVTRFANMSDFIAALDNVSPVSITPDEQEDHLVIDAPPGNKSWLVGLIALLGVLGFAGYQLGVVDKLKTLIESAPGDPVAVAPEPDSPDAAASEPLTTTTDEMNAEVELPETSLVPEPVVAEDTVTTAPAVPLVDFSTLPPADYEVALVNGGSTPSSISVTIREDAAPVVVDLVRSGTTQLALAARIEEVGHSGNRSPWSTRQFEISGGGDVTFPVGQDRARISLTMASDPLREPDQQSTLLIREADSASAELGKIEVALEDDDQRRFESELPSDTIAFAVSQVAIGERDPAVQIDVLRFNPTQQPIVVGYSLHDITASEGQDYFAPGGYSVRFSPGQRTARLLIPLVQDSEVEGDEAFTVELATDNSDLGGDVYQRIVIMIRDDDAPAQ